MLSWQLPDATMMSMSNMTLVKVQILQSVKRYLDGQKNNCTNLDPPFAFNISSRVMVHSVLFIHKMLAP